MRSFKQICKIMNDNSYVGREYVYALQSNEIFTDVVILGSNNASDSD